MLLQICPFFGRPGPGCRLRALGVFGKRIVFSCLPGAEMHSGGATTPGVLARREPDVAVPDTLTLAAWRKSDALRRSHEACGNCDRAFRSELGHCPTCGMPSGALTTDPIPAVLERVATTSRRSQKLKCLQGREQPVALQPGVACRIRVSRA